MRVRRIVADLVEAVEGRARLLLSAAERAQRGPGSKDAAGVFFNPAMAVNRDLGALLVRAHAQDGWTALDGLAASGVRGLRYALETGRALQVEWNDWNPLAVDLIKQNAARNGIEPRVTRRNLAALLWERVWHVIDIDPYGSPAPFLDAAGRAVRHGGFLGITATDTMALAGVHPKAALRRYGGRPLHGELGHEVALRLLAAAAIRSAARHEVALTPVLSHATDYYYRVVMRAQRGAARADEALAHVAPVFLCHACGARGFDAPLACPACGDARVEVAGPVWRGPLQDARALDAMEDCAQEATFARPESLDLLAALRAEADAPPLLFDLHKMGARLGLGSPATRRVLDALHDMGHETWPVHFNNLALRTRAPVEDVKQAVRAACAP